MSRLLTRMDGRIEWLCEHGIGHTIYNPNDWGRFTFSHGCDGCCDSEECKMEKKKLELH